MSERSQLARQLFTKGYSCSQAVVLSYSDMLGLEEDVLLKLASSFGGGMGRLREVCGAVSGILIVAGMLYGYSDPKDRGAKADHYKLVQQLANKFRQENGSIVCRELLGLSSKQQSHVPEERTSDYYKKRPCAELVEQAVAILDEYINNTNMEEQQ